MTGEIHVNDVGTTFVVTIKDESEAIVNVSSATITFIFGKPDGTEISRVGDFVTTGVDGKVEYITVAGDIDQYGSWKLQVFVDFGDSEWYSDIYKFKVYSNLGC